MHNPSVRHATSLLCDCCPPGRKEVLAKLVFDSSSVEVRDRRHGTAHVVARTLDQIVRAFDPLGTTYVRRNGSAA
jgi:hypothetical protein